MTYERVGRWAKRGALLVGALSIGAACNATSSSENEEQTGSVSSAVWTNGGFETSTANQAPGAPWVVTTNLNPLNTGITIETTEVLADLNLGPGGNPLTVVLNGTNQPDPDLGATASLRWCRYGNQCAIINQHGNNRNSNTLTQTMTVTGTDVDGTDGLVHVRFAVAPVLQNPAHAQNQQPYYFVQLVNNTKGKTLYSDFNTSGSGTTWKTINGGTATEIDYTDWQLVDINPGAANLAVGDSVTLTLIATGCSQNGHWGELYVDGVGSQLPGLNIAATGPADVNPGANITYTFTYKNGNTVAESGIVVSVTTPTNTTYTSFTPPAGVVCVPPVPGLAGTLTCTVGSLASGASGTFTMTVTTSAAATGSITLGTYSIQSTQESSLIGPKVVTKLGCSADTDCSAGNWCDEATALCTATFANGVAMPTDPPHTNPTLNGTCAAVGAAKLVCTSQVCDTDNKCGYLNGDGSCTAATGSVVCRSGVCDTDTKCGYANGDGPCTLATGPTVCRSGVCSTNGLCEPVGGCNVDADCTGGKWCAEATHTCTPKLTNGVIVPTDPPHANPVLNGTCTAQVGTLTCVSSVCDTTDNKCGYAVGDGPCVPGPAGNGVVVCRSGACSANGTCEPLGGCDVDADCTGGNWCDESIHTCTPKLGNGIVVPTDPPHTNPTLNGTCTAQAGTLVCVSSVCDTTDNKCGYANGDGSCIPGALGNGGVVCRSGACSTNGKCEPSGGCNVDADCSAGNWCNESINTCTLKIANGSPLPTDPPHSPTLNGMCTTAAGAIVCVSGVCDASNNECGYANGDGPCLTGAVCQSGACSNNGTCEPTGGCNVDADCTGGNWCLESTHACTAKLLNGAPVPTDPPHTNPTLNGTCTNAAGALVCVSTVCDTKDNDCGYANGDGPCVPGPLGTGPTVCRSGVCSNNGNCEPAGACFVDADCTGGNWCNESTSTCTAKIVNGNPVPNDPPHTNPTLDGTCSAGAGTLTCASGVCDTKDNDCGYAAGDGPCLPGTSDPVCRSGSCSVNGTCEPAGGCNVDSDCTAGNWCNESTSTCTPQIQNGQPMPSDPPHTSPTLDGTCTPGAALVVCQTGVCDSDNKCGYKNGDGPCALNAATCRSGVCDPDGNCGYANGDGPCTSSNGGTLCRSTICATTGTNSGLCEQCLTDTSCAGATPACDTTTNKCVQCSSTNGTACVNPTPLCNTGTEKCTGCNGDDGGSSTEPCPSGNPYCSLTGGNAGACGKCTTNADCTGHAGPICDPVSGACGTGCTTDSECSSSQWCNAATGGSGSCVPKLTNGTPLPTTPSTVATCSTMVGTRVCVSGVCDTKDNTCGYANGDGPCNGTPADCRSGACDKDGNCGYANGDGPCQNPGQCRSDKCATGQICVACGSDNDCPTGDFCSSAGACTPKLGNGNTCLNADQCVSDLCPSDGQCGLPNGQVCSTPAQCRSAACTSGLCGTGTSGTDAGPAPPVSETGSLRGGGLSCAVGSGSTSGNTASLFGLGLLAMGAAVRRVRRRSAAAARR